MAIPFTQEKDPNAAKKAAAEAARNKAEKKPDAIMTYVDASKCKDRMRVVFDDSFSMSSYIGQAKDGVVEFFRWCPPNEAACGMNFLNTHDPEMEKLTADLPNLGMLIKSKHFNLGGTPLFATMKKAVEDPILTRMIAFTDGSPTDSLTPYSEKNEDTLAYYKRSADVIIPLALEKHVPIDTVFFGSADSETEIALLKYFSDSTSGYFLHFDPNKVNFAKAFRFLAPVNRLMLASESVRREIESGKRS